MKTLRDKVLIYEDYGCSSADILERALESYYNPKGITVEAVGAAEIIQNNALNENILAFVMPGGAATPYRQKLKVLGNQKISDFVYHGGAYLGICAGAYYACSGVEFEADVPELKIVRQDGLLNLIDARAVGTLKKELSILPYAKNQEAATTVNLLWMADNESHTAHYHGGPRFEITDEKAEILATYEDIKNQPPAIIAKKFGKGKIVLSGVHFENSGADLQKTIHALQLDFGAASAVAQKLSEREASRKRLFDKVMHCLE